ncbi:tail assembly chaperone [Mycobacterium phage Iwokeuplikedis]|nr:tail assembly chaperone [Mycobacterium phage Iwokeuplikedis]
MTNVFTLDAVREVTKKKYSPVEIILSDESSVELKPLVRLGKKDREAVVAAIEEIKEINDLDDDEDEDEELVDEYAGLVCDAIAKVFKLICSSPRKLIAALEDDDPRVKAEMYTTVLQAWMGETQLGEAESSPS